MFRYYLNQMFWVLKKDYLTVNMIRNHLSAALLKNLECLAKGEVKLILPRTTCKGVATLTDFVIVKVKNLK
jgi:hypothetical protein